MKWPQSPAFVSPDAHLDLEALASNHIELRHRLEAVALKEVTRPSRELLNGFDVLGQVACRSSLPSTGKNLNKYVHILFSLVLLLHAILAISPLLIDRGVSMQQTLVKVKFNQNVQYGLYASS